MNQEWDRNKLGHAIILFGAIILLLAGVRSAFSATRISDEGDLDPSFSLPVFAAAISGKISADIRKLNSLVFQGDDGDDLDEAETTNRRRSSVRAEPGRSRPERVRRGSGSRNEPSNRPEASPRSRRNQVTISQARRPAERTGSRTQRRAGQGARKSSSFNGWPVAGRLSSRFGFRRHPITGRKRFHCGMDMAAPLGSPIHALKEGVVTFSGRKGGYGWCVDILHSDGVVTRYAHNSANLVRAGAKVRRGSVIAKVGSSGHSTGPHVHIEVIRRGTRINPQKFILRR